MPRLEPLCRQVLFDYGLKFLRGMATQRRKFFSVIWGTSLSHDLLNQPDEADALYERFLRDVLDTGVLNNTALVFLSDHGLRFGNVLKTYQARPADWRLQAPVPGRP